MSSSERNAKIYGAVETETFMTFEGFCKKIYNTEQQKIEVFIDDKKIDTILANQKISNIEDTYEVFDTEGFCFTYKLPKEYIGEKHKLEFKTIEGEQLIHSPFSTIDISDEKYNEYFFLESLKEPIDEEIYCTKTIGFLLTEMTLKDESFIDYIKELIIIFPNIEFKGFYFNKKILIDCNFNNRIKFICLSNMMQIIQEIEIFIWGIKDPLDLRITNFLIKNCRYIYPIYNFRNPYFINLKNESLSYFDEFYKNKREVIITNAKFFGFLNSEIEKYGESYFKLMYEALLIKEEKLNYILDLEQNALAFLQFEQIKLVFNYEEFKKSFIKIHKIRSSC